MAINSRAKGARAERELASKLRDEGYNCRRGQQFCGANGDADVVGLNGIFIECKHKQALNLHEAIEKAQADNKSDALPAVFHKKNGTQWLVTMTFDDWIKLYREWEASEWLKDECSRKQ